MTGTGTKPTHAVFLTCMILALGGCSQPNMEEISPPAHSGYEPGQVQVLTPESPGILTCESDFLSLDFSNADQGYFTGFLSSENTKINIQVIGPDEVTYKYFLEEPNRNITFPFTAGDGEYIILAFEHIGEDQYVSLFNYVLDVTLENEYLPFLYPNQYVDFSDSSEAILLAETLSEKAETDLAALELIYTYVTEHISYDDEKAATVETGYLPDIDETLKSGKGICFDYAALTASMLRSLSIPARLEIGYSSDVRHAWIDVYIESMGWVEKAIEFNGEEWKLMDPTFASAVGDSKQIKEYIGDGANYTLQYVR